MSRTIKGHKPPGYEYWGSRLHRYGEIPGPDTKLWTHRRERREGKRVASEPIRQAKGDA